MQKTLTQAGAGLNDIVHIDLYLRDINDLRKSCDVFHDIFGDDPPTRMTTTTDFHSEKCLCMICAVAYKTACN